jgi:NADH pyrophosphatase NudC (nudix superfamily)
MSLQELTHFAFRHQVIYHSSQPWPMPSQLMIGCLALVDGDETFRPEEDEFEEGLFDPCSTLKSSI